MAAHFNSLTPAEHERLVILGEEAAEVVQAVAKILRHGYDSYHHGVDNRNQLEKELGDLKHALIMMYDAEDISIAQVARYAAKKKLKIGKYLHHQGDNECRK